MCDLIWYGLDSPPEVGNKAVKIVDRLGAGRVRACEKHGERPRERLDVVGYVAQMGPDEVRGPAFTAETTGMEHVENSHSTSFLGGNAPLISGCVTHTRALTTESLCFVASLAQIYVVFG